MEYCIVNGELYHHGIKGQRWGVRRYQNKDGSLTNAGKKRYAEDAKSKGYNQQDEDGTYYRGGGKKGKGNKETYDPNANRYAIEDNQAAKRVLDDTSTALNKAKNISSREMRKASKNKMDLSNMTDQEMRDAINRANLERQYNDMFAEPSKAAKGRERVDRVLEVAGDIVTVGASALTIAIGIMELKDRLGV